MLPQYYRAADGTYRPTTAVPDDGTVLGMLGRCLPRRLYKRSQQHLRTLCLHRARLVQIAAVCASLACVGFFVTWQLSAGLPEAFNANASMEDGPTLRATAVISNRRPVLVGGGMGQRDDGSSRPPLPVGDTLMAHQRLGRPGGGTPTPATPTVSIAAEAAVVATVAQPHGAIDRANSIKQAMLHAWSGYERHAFGHDEVRPVTNRTNDSWNGWGVTLVDALDTLLLMGMRDEYARALAHVATIDFKQDKKVSFFETTIRYLGGLLGAYSLSSDQILLQKADELGELLMLAFGTPTGIAYNEINLLTGQGKNPTWTSQSSVLAETGSVQLEFKQLARLTGKSVYAEKAQTVMDVLDGAQKKLKGLYPVFINPNSGQFTTDNISVGALADSFYEYLLKQFIFHKYNDDDHERTEQFKRMYIDSIEGIKEHLIGHYDDRWYIGEYTGGHLIPRMDHLVCFTPGLFALGAHHLDRPEDLDLARKLMDTCRFLYSNSPSGIAPEIVVFKQDGSTTVESSKYYLRPETIESLFVLYRITGDSKYQDWGWEIFQAIEKYCRTPTAYSGLVDVSKVPPEQSDSMQSFFLAETLKYLYLLFSETNMLSLDEYVLNTEAHPFRLRSKKQ